MKPALSSLLERLHVLVIGPGLGREDYMQSFAKLALNIAKEQVSGVPAYQHRLTYLLGDRTCTSCWTRMRFGWSVKTLVL